MDSPTYGWRVAQGSVEFQLTDGSGNPTDGQVSKIFGGCAEMMAKVNKFNVNFPAGATGQQKMALLGTTILIDFEYFENVFIQRVNLHKTSEAMRSLIIENAGQVIGRIACELENLQGIHCWHDQALYKSAFANPTSWYEGRRSSSSLRC